MAQQTMIEWSEGFCHYTATFDTSDVDETLARNTIGFLFPASGLMPSSPGWPVFDLRVVPRKNPAFLRDVTEHRRQCDAALENASRMELLPLPGLQSYRSTLAARSRQLCEFHEIEGRAMAGDISALRGFVPAADACSQFITALESPGGIRPFWSEFVMAQCGNNGNRGGCLANARREAEGDDGPDRMRLYVLQYGWNNCAVRFLEINAGHVEPPPEMFRSFEQHVSIRESDCHPESAD